LEAHFTGGCGSLTAGDGDVAATTLTPLSVELTDWIMAVCVDVAACNAALTAPPIAVTKPAVSRISLTTPGGIYEGNKDGDIRATAPVTAAAILR